MNTQTAEKLLEKLKDIEMAGIRLRCSFEPVARGAEEWTHKAEWRYFYEEAYSLDKAMKDMLKIIDKEFNRLANIERQACIEEKTDKVKEGKQ